MYMYLSLYRRRSYSLHINIMESGDEIANQVMKFVNQVIVFANQVIANQVIESGDNLTEVQSTWSEENIALANLTYLIP